MRNTAAITARIISMLSVGAVLLGMTACNDKEGGSTTVSPAVTYSGSTDPTAITLENGATVSSRAYKGQNLGVATGIELQGGTDSRSVPLTLVNALGQWAKNIYANSDRDMAAGVTGSFQGDCGGTQTDTYTETATTITGNMTYNNYCDSIDTDGATLNGTLTYSGQMSGTDYDTHITMTMTTLSTTMQSSTEDATMSGTLAMAMDIVVDPNTTDLTQFTMDITMNLAVRDNATGRLAKLENFVVATDMTDFTAVALTIDGRFYDSVDGYVDIATTQPFVFDLFDSVTQGEIVFTGAQNSSVTLSITGSDTYQLDIDADGIGGPDSTETGTWSTFLNAA